MQRNPLALLSTPTFGILALLIAVTPGCEQDEPPHPSSSARPAAIAPGSTTPPFDPPNLLYLPDGGDLAPPEAPFDKLLPPGTARSRCPQDMVDIRATFCIDRYESSLRDMAQGRVISPYYHPEHRQLFATHRQWLARAPESKTALGQSLAVPAPPAFQLEQDFDIRASSERGVVPNGYLNLELAKRACANAGKRLCRHDEWVLACRGQQSRKFPYGDTYQAGRCNVFREAHPAALLHGNASINHLDPRLNLTRARGRPLLRRTGETDSCRSEWGQDAVYDMVGNLDEWIDDPEGIFVGGFFSRATKEGCDAAIHSHPPEYFDYSLGTRCCADL